MTRRGSSIGTVRSATLPTIFALTVCMLAAGQALFHDDSFAATNFTISPPTISLPLTVGQANTSITLTVKNTGTASASFLWSDTLTALTTLNTSTNPINLTAGRTFLWTVTVVPPATAGTYTGAITIASGGQSTIVPVTLTVTGGSTTPAIGLSPTNLAFTGIAGGTNPAAKTIGISNSGGGTLTWSAADNAAWLTLSPTSGTNAGTVNANVNLAGLAAGTYTAIVTVTAPGATSKTIPVTLTISPAGSTAGFTVSPPTISLPLTVGQANTSITLTVKNTGTASASFLWSDTLTALTTLNTSTNPINLTAGRTFLWTVTVVPPATAGTYTGAITIASGGQSTIVPVTLTVTGGSTTPAIGLSPTNLAFTGIAGGTNPAAKTIGISNSGGGTLTWSAADNAAWLTLSPTSGTNAGTVNANVNLAGLAAGTYNAIVTVTAPGATSKTIPVTLTITAATGGATIGFSPTNLTFTGTAGSTNPAAKTIGISNSGGGTLTWSAADNAAWLTLSPASGINSGTITASVNTSGLAAGTYTATITVTAPGSTNSPSQIPVSLTLSATGTGTATLAWNASTESDLAGYKVYRGTASGTYGAPLATLPKTTTSYIATGLQTGTTYFFVITAYDSAGNESTFSNEVSKSIF